MFYKGNRYPKRPLYFSEKLAIIAIVAAVAYLATH